MLSTSSQAHRLSAATATLRQGLEALRQRWPDVQSHNRESPVLLFASGFRSGSTLLQRMLSRGCLMWGEPYGHSCLIESVSQVFRQIKPNWPEESFFFHSQSAAQRSSSFIANLYPSPQAIVDGYCRFFETLFALPAQQAGIARWGIKEVRCSADHAQFFRWLFPDAKILFLIRNPYDAFRSYSAILSKRQSPWFIRWPDRPLDAHAFGEHWRELTTSFLEFGSELNARVIRYEDLTKGSVDLVELEEHTGVELDLTALESNPGGWPTPSNSVDERSLKLVRESVEPLADELGYHYLSKPSHTQRSNSRANGQRPTGNVFVELDDDPGGDVDIDQALKMIRQGQLDAARQLIEDKLSWFDKHSGAWHARGLLHMAQRDFTAANDCIQRAIKLNGFKPVYHNNLGVALIELRKLASARSAFLNALELNQDYADAWANLGRTHSLSGAHPAVIEKSLLNALRLDAHHRDALLLLASFYREHGKLDQALALWKTCTEKHGANPATLLDVSKTLEFQGKFEDACFVAEQAIALEPNSAELHFQLASVRASLDNWAGAESGYRRAAELAPHKPTWRWKHLSTCPSLFIDDDSIEAYWYKLNEGLDRAAQELPQGNWNDLAQDAIVPPFNLPHHGKCCRSIKEKYSALFDSWFPEYRPEFRAGLDAGRPVRIGFVVTAGHENGFVRGTCGIIAGLDQQRFEPIVFCPARSVEKIRKAIDNPAAHVVAFKGSVGQVVQSIRKVACDVVYFWKVGADTWNYTLAMARLAPVQCTSWGTHGTSGVAAVDYYLSSPWMETSDVTIDCQAHYTEKLALLPIFPTYQRRQQRRKPIPRSQFGLPDAVAIYFCPHRLPKYHPDFDGYLRGILESDTTGHLAVLTSNQRGEEFLRSRFARTFSASELARVHFYPAMKPDRYFALMNLATVVLDSPAYAGGITAYDAFSFGVPVVTQPGSLAVQNYTSGLLRRMHIPELIASNVTQYITTAVGLGTDLARRESLRKKILNASAAIFEEQEAIHAHETFFLSAVGCIPFVSRHAAGSHYSSISPNRPLGCGGNQPEASN